MASDYITASDARHLINGYVLDWISDLMMAGDPELAKTDQDVLVWRMPVYLTLPSIGRVGMVGIVDIEAKNGEIMITADDINRIVETAIGLIAKHQEADK